MLLVFTHKITPRVTYVFKHIFENMLELQVKVTSSVEALVAHSGPKMSYTTKPLGDEFFVASHPLLFERGITSHDINIDDWEGVPAFFKTGENNPIPFDVFAASFFLLSRYEEFLPQIKSLKGHFDPMQSLAFQEGFLELPLVDHWIFKMHGILTEVFPEIKPLSKGKPQKEILIDVPLVFQYRHRSLLVTLELFLKSLWDFNFLKIFDQVMVLTRLRSDPFDSFSFWNTWFENSSTKPKVFFLYAKSSAYESTISTFNRRLQQRIKKMGDDYSLGLLLSVHSQLKSDPELSKEKKDFQDLTHRQVKMSRIPISYRQLSKVYTDLVDYEFSNDYSMGYSDRIGFRASTATPFYFYDLTNEFQLPLKVHPVFATETAIRKGKKIKAFDELNLIYEKLPLPCARLTLAIGNGFLHPKKQYQPLQKAFKEYVK